MPIDHRAIQMRILGALNAHNYDEWETFVTEDYTEEYPQSGEVIRGRKNVRAVLENYPGGLAKLSLDVSMARMAATEARWVKTPTFTMVRVEGSGNVGTAAFKARYPDETVWWVINLYELRGDLVAKNTAFFAPLFEAPEWRKPYAERSEAMPKP
ncbi:MAG: nuclear transport factor 2 family protein [Chloroflexi bacterium]|nr:MAG: nuclear transport factor 2 family protein [Chloroflexota bacterium]